MDFRELGEKMMKDFVCVEPPFTPPQDMSKGEIGILTYLTFVKNNVLSGELSAKLNITTGRIAIALKGLERKGFISRTKGSEDKRQVVVSVTEKGKEKAHSQKEKALDDISNVLTLLGEEDAKEFVRLIYKIYGLIR